MSRTIPTASLAATEPIDRSVAGAVWAALETFRRLPRATVTHGRFATAIASRSPYATFNNVVDTRLPDDPTADGAIRDILVSFAPDSLPVTWWVGPTTTPVDLGARLERLGLRREEPEFGMALALTGPAATPWLEAQDRFGGIGRDAKVTVDTVDDLAGLGDWLSVMGAAYGWPDGPKTELFRAMHVHDFAPAGDQRDIRHFVVREAGRAVASSSLFTADGHAFVTNIGTVPDARGRGLGTAATVATLDLARQLGRDVATLTASVAGRGVYRRLGFREGGVLDRWIAGPHVVGRFGELGIGEARHAAG